MIPLRAMLRDNIPLAQMILRTVMEKPDLVITELKTQADMNRVTGARSVCLDAYGADSEGKKYMNFPLMAEKTRYLKENPKGVSEMCAIMDDIRNKGRAEVLEQGRLEMLAGLVSKGILTLQQAAEERSLTVDDFKKQCKLYNLSL